jgi:hypothetical protein
VNAQAYGGVKNESALPELHVNTSVLWDDTYARRSERVGTVNCQ